MATENEVLTEAKKSGTAKKAVVFLIVAAIVVIAYTLFGDLLSRFLFRDSIQKRFGQRLESFNEALEREGPFFLFTMRLIPAVPFFVINAVMGLTPIRMTTFWWVSQFGMLAGTAIYVYTGSSVSDLQTLADDGIGAVFSPSQLTQIVIAFVLLGLFPLIVRFAMKYIKRMNAGPNDSSTDQVSG